MMYAYLFGYAIGVISGWLIKLWVGFKADQEVYRDRWNRVIKTGDIVVYCKRKGLVKEEDREGQYIEFRDGFKLRVSAFHMKVKVVANISGVKK